VFEAEHPEIIKKIALQGDSAGLMEQRGSIGSTQNEAKAAKE
jgi:hypothetical protein